MAAMAAELWFLVVGALLIVTVLAGTLVRRLPLTVTMVYLAAGVALGPLGLAAWSYDVLDMPALLERLAEIGVIVSLFTAGLKLRTPLGAPSWRVPLRLAFVAMAITVGLIALLGVVLLELPLGAAVLLGAVLAPTDPVLASDVQLESPSDRDELRFALTAEAGLNDGTAFPFVMLGLALLGIGDAGTWGATWLARDLVWATVAGLAIGAAAGVGVGRLVVLLRREHAEALGRDEFLALGLILGSYGLALLAHAYGFLAVFAAGLALRAVERRSTGERPPEEVVAAGAVGRADALATDPDCAPAYMADAALAFNEQLERVLEVGLVLFLGAALGPEVLRTTDLWLAAALFLLVRPAAVTLSLVGTRCPAPRVALLSWFGIRGIGSLYYLTYAIGRGVPEDVAQRLVLVTLATVAASIVVHGASARPLLRWYAGRAAAR
jgi:NhaP-type Na+/H+ or K+/H+ antiporter